MKEPASHWSLELVIREDDDPKRAMMKRWKLTDAQAEAILNMRLRSLRRLEEMELLAEQEALMRERAELEDLLAEESLQWARISDELREVRKAFGKGASGGARRSSIEEAAEGIQAEIPGQIVPGYGSVGVFPCQSP